MQARRLAVRDDAAGAPLTILRKSAAALYEELWEKGGIHLIINSYVGVLTDKDLNEEISEFVRAKIREIVRDPETARKLMPDYYIGTKRMILDNGYFETYNRENVSLVDLREDPIEAFTPTSVRTKPRRASDRRVGARHRLRCGERFDAEPQPERPRRGESPTEVG